MNPVEKLDHEEWLAEEEKKCFLTPVTLPEGHRVIVFLDDFHYSGKIVIPDNAKRKPSTGHVIRVSDLEALSDLLGKRVLFGMYAGTLAIFKGQAPYRVLDSREILAVIEMEDAELDTVE